MVVGWELTIYAKHVHLIFHGYNYGQPLSFLTFLFLIGVPAPLVSYRRRDALLMLVPIYNLVVLWTIGSRLARLPVCDWPQRPDETAAAVTTHAG